MKIHIRKILLILILFITYIIVSFVWSNKSFAITQTVTTDVNSIDSSQYPQIKEMITTLKNAHPNWNYKILYTDLEWQDVLANEYYGHGASPRNLIPANNSNYDGEWICPICGSTKKYDNGKWCCASELAIAYMMDPRNSLNDSDLFQFMELSYYDCNMDTIRAMVANSFLNNDSYLYTLITAAQKYNVNPYYAVARLLQEQGKTGSVLVSGKGYNGQYYGYYNAFNIGANGNTKEKVILNGLSKAEKNGWTTLESSIDGGMKIISSDYIAKGQNTIYFQKFDVENSDGNLYWHQYMQNLIAAQNEGAELRKTFTEVGSLEGAYTFVIPVYKNMPSVSSRRPSTTSVSVPSDGELVRINVTNSLRLRNAPNGSTTVGWVYKDEIVTRLIKATQKEGGTYWDYVMKADGTKGYAARETYDNEATYKLYLVPLVSESTPLEPEDPNSVIKNEKVKMNTSTNKISTVPSATVDDVKNLLGADIVIKGINGEVLTGESKLATGCTINDTYTISVLGDINSDGEVDTADLLSIQKQLLKIASIPQNEKSVAADINYDQKIDTADLLAIQKKLLKISDIHI